MYLNQSLSIEVQGDRKGLPYIFADALCVGETLTVSLPFDFVGITSDAAIPLRYLMFGLPQFESVEM